MGQSTSVATTKATAVGEASNRTEKKTETDLSECPRRHGDDAQNLPNSAVNQCPGDGQQFSLSTVRQVSSIPKEKTSVVGGPPGNWVYPSAQMMWNAVAEKDADLGPEEIHRMTAIHNATNELAWEEILLWERGLHWLDCSRPRLKGFRPRNRRMTPTAIWWKMWWGKYCTRG